MTNKYMITTFKDILESTTSNSTPGYQTPYAFTGDEDDKELIKKFISIIRWTVAKRKKMKTADIKENIEPSDYSKIKDLIRAEIASIMYLLFRKRSMWMENKNIKLKDLIEGD